RRRLLARGYALLAAQRGPGEEPFDLTSILADNAPALRLLGAGVPGLPTYRLLARFVTVVIPAWRSQRARPGVAGRAARAEDFLEIAACLERNARRFQLARRFSARDLLSPERSPGLRPEDLYVALDGGRVVGTAALWDQAPFKQVVVRGYAPGLARW